jgi:peptide chain release factor 2
MLESAPEFWNDNARAKTVLKEKASVEGIVKGIGELEGLVEEGELALEVYEGEEAQREASSCLSRAAGRARSMEIQAMLGGEQDNTNAIFHINAGAGGTEAQDWAQILMRMYLRYCEKQGYKTAVVDAQDGEEAGIKSTTFTVEGPYAFGFLKAEIGVHRLVRISPFDSNARRHTSFASVYVYPDIEDSIDIQIEEKDLRIDTYRAGGKGGQKVNKTDSAVRITHLPTNIVVQCQNERSQLQNRQMAMKILKARLYERELEAKKALQKEVEDSKMDIAWGSQIRSYVLAPYRMIKDHRTDFEVGDVDRVLDGDLQGFIEAYLMSGGPK